VRRNRLLCALVVTVAVLAGCGDDDTPAAVDDLVDSRSAEEQVADFGLADAALLRLSDLPAGWKVDAPDDDAEAEARLMDCLDPPHRDVAENEVAEAQRAFEVNDAHLNSSVEAHPSVAYAIESFSVVRLDSFSECYRTALERSLRDDAASSGAAIDIAVYVERRPDPDLGDEAAAIRIGVDLAGPGGQRHMVVDLIGFRVGRFEAGLTLIELGVPFDPVLADLLLRLTRDRLPA
jgi:hypothetical protein